MHKIKEWKKKVQIRSTESNGKVKKNIAFGLNVHVIKAQQACYIIYFLITFIFSQPKVFQHEGHTMNLKKKRGERGMGESYVFIKYSNNNKKPYNSSCGWTLKKHFFVCGILRW